MYEIRLPSLGAEMEEGTLLEWYVKPGDVVAYGQVIALLDTEKAEIEMESFAAGTIESLLIEPGETVQVGTPVARLQDAEAARAAAPTTGPSAPAVAEASCGESSQTAVATPAFASNKPPSLAQTRARATPLARRLAAERGIDLASISGTGPNGAVVADDIPSPPLTSRAAPAAATVSEARTPQAETRADRRRGIIAAAMQRSKREIPHYYLATPIEVGAALDWLAETNAGRDTTDRLLLPALLMKSVAVAAKRVPAMNGHWRDGRFEPARRVDLGMVVSLRTGGIMVPTFNDVGERGVEELMAELRDIVGRVRTGRLRSTELGEASLTLTSLGDRGAESIFGVIYPPQVAIVGFGGIYPQLVSQDGLIGARPAIRTSLAGDHRASDGQEGSRFLEFVARALRTPEEL